MSAITLDGVSKHYGGVRAVEDIALEVKPGEFVTVLGPSGSGKSTLLNLIAGLIEPTAGRILIGGRDVTLLPAAQRNVGLVFQSYALFPNMSVAGNVAFPLAVRGLSRAEIGERVEEALRRVRLTGLERRRPSQLSGGQQQRVALARAIVFKPEILLLDEPLAALDRKLREDVRVELLHLQRSLGITTILVTHDQEEALSLSDRVVVLDAGRVRQVDRPDDAYLRPNSRFVAEFLGTANFLEGTAEPGPDGWTIRLNGGLVVPSGDPRRPPMTRVCGVLRPERVYLGRRGAGGSEGSRPAGGLEARVTEAIYLGQSVRYHLRLNGGPDMIVVAADREGRHEPGEVVHISWLDADVWIVPLEQVDAGTPRVASHSMADGGERGNLETERRRER